MLVGGESRRMGADKALLELRGKPLFLHAVDLLRPRVAEVMLLGPPERYARFSIPVLADRRPDRGPLAALATGLEAAAHDWNLFLACDLPLLEGRFLDFLLERARATDAEAVVPRTADGWQPLCAAYHRRCLPRMQHALETDKRAIVDVLPSLRVEPITEERLAEFGFDPRMFRNINTAEDWAAVLRGSRSQL